MCCVFVRQGCPGLEKPTPNGVKHATRPPHPQSSRSKVQHPHAFEGSILIENPMGRTPFESTFDDGERCPNEKRPSTRIDNVEIVGGRDLRCVFERIV